MRKRLLAYFLCVCMVLTLLPCTAFAADRVVDEGWCGRTSGGLETTVHWQLTGSNPNQLTLTIKGDPKNPNGYMADFNEEKK